MNAYAYNAKLWFWALGFFLRQEFLAIFLITNLLEFRIV